MRKLIVALVVLAVVLVAADRITVRFVERSVADRMQEDGRLDLPPDVEIHGFPFLTQAFRGVYDRTDVHIRDLTRNGVTVSRLDVTVLGAQLPLDQVGKATQIPVDGLRATAVISYYALAHSSGLAGLTVTPAGDRVAVTGTVAGVKATATSDVTLRGDRIIVTARNISAVGVSVPVKGLLDFSVRVPALPYGLHLTSAQARPDGVHLTATSGRTVLTPH